MFQTINQCSMQIILWLQFCGVWQKRNYIDTGRNMETELGRDSFLEGLECVIRLQKAYCEYIRTTPLKCYYDQKLTSIFFFDVLSRQVSSLYVHGKCDQLSHDFWLRPATITKFTYDREQLRKLGRKGEVTSSNQDSNVATLVAKLKLTLK